MLNPRWKKILRDLWGTKLRTLLVVLSIAIGVLAIGIVTQTFTTIQEELEVDYPTVKPAHATLTTQGFDDELLQTVRHIPGVQDAEGRAVVSARIRIDGSNWRPLLMNVVADFHTKTIDQIKLQLDFPSDTALGAERTVLPPPERGLVFERSSFLVPGMTPAGIRVGDSVEIETADGKRRSMKFSGLVHQPSQYPATFMNTALAYITPDTAEWLMGSRLMNQVAIRVDIPQPTQKQVKDIAEQVRAKIENGGKTVYAVQVLEPDKHPLDNIFRGLLLLLNTLGISALLLSGFLIVNTVAALLAQQVRQIGIMKAIGARQYQIIGLYLVMVLIYGVLAFLIAAPLAALISSTTTNLLAGFINVDFPPLAFKPDVVMLQAAIAILFPVIAGFFPVINGTRTTVREAISDYGLGQGIVKRSIIDRLIDRMRGLSRPTLMSLKNTFRRKGRLALTLTTLTLGGAMFMSVISMHASMLATLDDVLKYWQFDVFMQFSRTYRTEVINEKVLQVPGVVYAESWGLDSARRVRPDKSESDGLTVFAIREGSKMIQPTMIAGRWLVPEDQNAVVISNGITDAEKDLKVGDDLILKINNKESAWKIIGIVRVVGSLGGGVGPAYVNYQYYTRVTGEVGRAASVQIETDRHDSAYQDQIQKALEETLKAAGMRPAMSLTTGLIRQSNEVLFNILVGMLLVMAILMAAVGGLGLMGTMSLNVIERTREIGVMRAIGATNSAIRGIVLTEGVLIGLVSWAIGALISIPFGRLVSEALGILVFELPLRYQVSTNGIVGWLILVLVISALASILPAQNAARLTVREILAYEG